MSISQKISIGLQAALAPHNYHTGHFKLDFNIMLKILYKIIILFLQEEKQFFDEPLK